MTARQKTALVFADRTRAGAQAALEKITARLADCVTLIPVELNDNTLDNIAQTPGDLGIVLGGDGTILRIARAHGDHQRPLLGINLGKLGYLAEFGMDELDHITDRITGDGLVISRRLMLESQLEADGTIFRSHAVNDVVLQAGPPFRMVELGISVNNEKVTSVSGDGLIVSTATGSTGHNISAGGPVVDFPTAAIILTPICPHSLTYRSVVLSGEAKIAVRAKRINRGSALIIDGQVTRPLWEGATLRLSAAKGKFLLVHNDRHSRWHTLQAKLNWGVGLNYDQ